MDEKRDVDMDKDKKKEMMREIRDEVINLRESPLFKTRVKPVIGEGSHLAEVILVGEAPGKNEAETGRPFCGAAGRILDELLSSIGLPMEEVYITNIVKDRPPNNRDPEPGEIELYAPFLDRQINIIRPKVIATLGRFSMMYLMERYGLKDELRPISSIHGRRFSAEMPYGPAIFVPLYHPAVALYNGSTKKGLLEDFKVIKEILSGN